MHHPLPTTPLPMVPDDQPCAFRTVEIEICTACDLACFGCDRMSDVTNAPNMALEQVSLFVDESIVLAWPWERIRVLGGEPTLHPRFMDIVKLLCAYRHLHNKEVFLQVLSNGQGKSAKFVDTLRDNGVDLHFEQKHPGVQPGWFRNTRIAPVDRDPDVGALEPCGIFDRRGCGIGLTRHGYFLDGAGASVARVAGLDIGVMHLKDVTMAVMMEQSKVLCRLCGHWNPKDGPEVTEQVSETGHVTGAFWTKALADYNSGKTRKLGLYGGDHRT